MTLLFFSLQGVNGSAGFHCGQQISDQVGEAYDSRESYEGPEEVTDIGGDPVYELGDDQRTHERDNDEDSEQEEGESVRGIEHCRQLFDLGRRAAELGVAVFREGGEHKKGPVNVEAGDEEESDGFAG